MVEKSVVELGLGHIPDDFNDPDTETHYDELFVRYPEEGLAETFRKHCKYNEEMIEQEYNLPELLSDYIHQYVDTSVNSIAEIGIGTGLVSNAIFGRDVTAPWDGYDLSKNACEFSKDFYQNTIKHDINISPLPKKYDLIIMCGVFETTQFHLDATCLDNIKESLHDNGKLVVTLPRQQNYWEKSGWEYHTAFQEIHGVDHLESWKFYIMQGRRQGYHDIKTFEKVN